VGVGGIVLRKGRVLLIRRGKEPLRGEWVVPGGTVEAGETLEGALVREMLEETGILVRPRETVAVFDRILRRGRRIAYHYVIVDYLCDYVEGTARAGSDAADVAWVGPDELGRLGPPAKVVEVVAEAFRRRGLARSLAAR
jgi:ADP-ribose pyrophosphatase YjhB (NUDIX family)